MKSAVQGVFVALVFATLHSPVRGQPADANRDEELSPNRGVIELILPPKAEVSIDGRDYGDRRYFQYSSLDPQQRHVASIRVQLPSGKAVERQIFLQGGYHVRWPVPLDATVPARILTQSGHSQAVTSIALSRDGSRLLTGSLDTSVIVWDVKTGIKVRTFDKHTQPVSAVAISPDGKFAVSCTNKGPFVDAEVFLWQIDTGEIKEKLSGHKGGVRDVAFAATGKQVVAGGETEIAIVWSVPSGETLQTLSGHKGTILAVDISPDGTLVGTGAEDETAIVWEVETGKPAQTVRSTLGAIEALAFHPDGKRLATGAANRELVLWDVETGKPQTKIGRIRHGVNTLSFNRDGSLLLVGSKDRVSVLIDAAEGKVLQTFVGDALGPVHAVLGPQGKRLVTREGSGLEPSEVTLWNAETKQRVRRFRGQTERVRAVDFSPEGDHFLVLAGGAHIFDTATGEAAAHLSSTKRPFTTAVLGRQQQVLTASDELQLWTLPAGKLVRTFAVGDVVPDVALNFARARAVTAGARPAVWDLESGKPSQIFSGHNGRVFSVALSNGGRWVVSGGADDGDAYIWDANNGQAARTFRGESGLTAVALAGDNSLVLTGNRRGGAALWDVRTSQELRTLSGHSGAVTAARFGPQKRVVVTAGADGKAIVWDAARDRTLREFTRHEGAVNAISIDSRGRFLLTGSADGTARLWDLFSGDLLAQIICTGEEWLAVTPNGMVDGSQNARQQFAVGVGDRVVLAERLFEHLHVPGLLAQLLDGKRPLPRAPLTQLLDKPGTDGPTLPQQQ